MPTGIPKVKSLFRFEVFVTDRQLGDALALLSGRVTQVTPPQLIANAAAGSNGIIPTSSGELVEMFMAWLRQHKLKEFDRGKTIEFLKSIGRSPNGANYLQAKAKQSGLIIKVGNSPVNHWRLKEKAKRAKPDTKTAATP